MGKLTFYNFPPRTHRSNYIYVCVYIYIYIHTYTHTAFEIQVLRTSVIKCRGKFRIFQFASAMRQQKITAEDLAETLVYHVGKGFGIAWHFVKDYDLVL